MLEILLRASLEGAILVGAVWALCRFVPRLSPATRTALWWCVAAKFVLALVWTTPVDIPILPPSAASAQEARAAGAGQLGVVEEAATSANAGSTSESAGPRRTVRGAVRRQAVRGQASRQGPRTGRRVDVGGCRHRERRRTSMEADGRPHRTLGAIAGRDRSHGGRPRVPSRAPARAARARLGRCRHAARHRHFPAVHPPARRRVRRADGAAATHGALSRADAHQAGGPLARVRAGDCGARVLLSSARSLRGTRVRALSRSGLRRARPRGHRRGAAGIRTPAARPRRVADANEPRGGRCAVVVLDPQTEDCHARQSVAPLHRIPHRRRDRRRRRGSRNRAVAHLRTTAACRDGRGKPRVGRIRFLHEVVRSGPCVAGIPDRECASRRKSAISAS